MKLKKCLEHNLFPELFIVEYEEDDPIWKGATILVIKCNHSVDLGDGLGHASDSCLCTYLDISKELDWNKLPEQWNGLVDKIKELRG